MEFVLCGAFIVFIVGICNKKSIWGALKDAFIVSIVLFIIFVLISAGSVAILLNM